MHLKLAPSSSERKLFVHINSDTFCIDNYDSLLGCRVEKSTCNLVYITYKSLMGIYTKVFADTKDKLSSDYAKHLNKLFSYLTADTLVPFTIVAHKDGVYVHNLDQVDLLKQINLVEENNLLVESLDGLSLQTKHLSLKTTLTPLETILGQNIQLDHEDKTTAFIHENNNPICKVIKELIYKGLPLAYIYRAYHLNPGEIYVVCPIGTHYTWICNKELVLVICGEYEYTTTVQINGKVFLILTSRNTMCIIDLKTKKYGFIALNLFKIDNYLYYVGNSCIELIVDVNILSNHRLFLYTMSGKVIESDMNSMQINLIS